MESSQRQFVKERSPSDKGKEKVASKKEETKCWKKVCIIYTDPDAIYSSSEEDNEVLTDPKQCVLEIMIPNWNPNAKTLFP